MEGRAGGSLLHRQAVEHADVVGVGRRPAVGAVADVGRDAALTGEADQRGGEAVVVEVEWTIGASRTTDERTPCSARPIV